MDIKIKAKLKAYTKGIIPDVSKFVEEAPVNGKLYARRDAKWEDISEALLDTAIELEDNSGLHYSYDAHTHTYTLGVNKEDLTQTQFEGIDVLAPDTVYYVEDQTANTFVDGGTAYSNGGNEFVEFSEFTNEVNGGESSSIANIEMHPLNSKGVYNG